MILKSTDFVKSQLLNRRLNIFNKKLKLRKCHFSDEDYSVTGSKPAIPGLNSVTMTGMQLSWCLGQSSF